MQMQLVFLLLCQCLLSLGNPSNGSLDKNDQSRKSMQRKRCLADCHAPRDCSDIQQRGAPRDGVYIIYPAGPRAPLPVFCDMTTGGGPWTVFQRRFDGSVNFYRGWADYVHGFGHADGEYWLGLKHIHLLTLQRKYKLRVELEDFDNNATSASYAEFSLSPGAINAAEDGYSLHVAGFTDGGAGDSLTPHSGEKFSTLDKEQDRHAQHCAEYAKGAFWYHEYGCVSSNLNGDYLGSRPRSALMIGFIWSSWRGPDYSLKGSQMKIRPA
ncbi:microfibril-associated glycoprotein 4-like [Ambystoma mexicanum]|uniref:microfibril-associated glycoprotein 4-like n=1 Tax=Ambystoma mexicanum TaxID=8296 RepID=UPI0037E79756